MRAPNFHRILRRLAVFSALASLFVSAPHAAETARSCGSHRDRLQAELQLHRKATQNRIGRGGGIGILAAGAERRPATTIQGDIVLMEDGDGVVSRRNDFDLDNQTVSFAPVSPEASAYRFSVTAGGYDAGAAMAGDRIEGFDDDDTQEIPLPFAFPFYGSSYSSIYVNSDGNMTLGGGDIETLARSLDRLTTGLPRIAPFFRDMDPSRSDDGVHVLTDSNRAVISWVSVPEFSSFGRGQQQTFQAVLHADGRIDFAYTNITSLSAVVGLSPGGGQGNTRVVSFVDGSDEEFSGTVAERFTSLEEVDVILGAQKFYEEHDDAYDYLVFYNSLGIDADIGTVAYELTIRNRRTGIGDPLTDYGKIFGSDDRLQAVLNLGPLNQYPSDPNAVVLRRATAGDTPLSVLGHEAGHLFLAFASVRSANDPEARPMLGRDGAHWSFVFNSEASLLEGNRICDRQIESCPADPQGTRRFVTTATVEGYSPLDQYLMGFRPPWEVRDTFVVEDPSLFNVSRMPQRGVNFNGRRRNIRIGELIAAEGPRTPDHTLSQRSFRFAFVLVHGAGAPPDAVTFEKVDRYRREFEAFFNQAAGGRASADTSIRRGLHLSLFPATGILTGANITGTIEIARPNAADLDVLITSDTGAAAASPSVRIPAGATSAPFSIAGARAGVDTITVEAVGGEFAPASARVQVLDAGSGVRIELVSGSGQVGTPGQPLPKPVVVRVTDANRIPYPGVHLQASPSGAGEVAPPEAITNAEGSAEFQWSPDASPSNELRISIAGVAGSPEALVTTTGQPDAAAGAIVNAASFAPVLAPGSIASIFGVNLAAGAEAVAGLPAPRRLEGVQVIVNGQESQLLYVSDRQINFIVPATVLPGPSSLMVSTLLGETGALPIEVRAFAPAIFTMPGNGEGAVLVNGTGQLTSQRPASAGTALEVYCTGLGRLIQIAAGEPLTTQFRPRATVGGVTAEVTWSGQAPGFAGLYQVNIVTPAGLEPGSHPLILTTGGAPSPPVPITIQ